MSLLGIDIGTTGTKGGVFTADGRMLAFAARSYPLIVPDAVLVACNCGLEIWLQNTGKKISNTLL